MRLLNGSKSAIVIVFLLLCFTSSAWATVGDENYEDDSDSDTNNASITLDGWIYTQNDANSNPLKFGVASCFKLSGKCLVFEGSDINKMTEVTVKTEDGSEFKLNSLKIFDDSGVNIEVSAYKDGVLVSGSAKTISNFPHTFDVSSDSNWQNIDEIKFTGDFVAEIDDIDVDDPVVTSSTDSDATLTASATINEPIPLPTTIDTEAEAVNLFDFTITDGGGADGLTTDVTQIVLHTSGTADFTKVTWRLNGANVSDVVGAYDNGAKTLTFSNLAISVASGGSQTYTLTGYYSTPTGLSDNKTYIFSVDGDTDLTLDGAKTQMGTTTAVDNGTGTKVDVTASKFRFGTLPTNKVP